MIQRVIPVEPFDYIVFGGTGDLSRRKLLPALYHRFRDGQIPSGSRIIARLAARHVDDEYRAVHPRQRWRSSCRQDERDAKATRHASSACSSTSPPMRRPRAGWDKLGEILRRRRGQGARLLPRGRARISSARSAPASARHGLVTPTTRVVIEKPIGHDLESARAVNEAVGAVFSEDQIFRIDHYLGKETVQNLMVLRFGNALFEPLWNSAIIDHVQITVAETLGVGSARRLLRYRRRAPRHGPEPHAAAPLPGRDGAARQLLTPTRSATRS